MEAYYGTDLAEKWRKDVSEYFEKYTDCFETINPTDFYKYGENYHKTDKEVFRFDLRKVSHSDIVLVNLNDIRKSIGSCIEIYEAHRNGISVIGFLDNVVSIEKMKKLIHPWIYYCMDRIETGNQSMMNACDYICSYYGD